MDCDIEASLYSGNPSEFCKAIENLISPSAAVRLEAETATSHTKVHSVIVAPPKKGVPHVARVRIGTMNPAPLLVALQRAGISYSFADLQPEEDSHA